MNETAEGRRLIKNILREADFYSARYEPNRRLAQIAELLKVPVSKLREGISPHSNTLLDQSVMMMSLFTRIEDPAARASLIAAAHDALGEAGKD